MWTKTNEMWSWKDGRERRRSEEGTCLGSATESDRETGIVDKAGMALVRRKGRVKWESELTVGQKVGRKIDWVN